MYVKIVQPILSNSSTELFEIERSAERCLDNDSSTGLKRSATIGVNDVHAQSVNTLQTLHQNGQPEDGLCKNELAKENPSLLKTYLETDNVFLFIPNIIDYLRGIFILLFMVHAAKEDYKTAAMCYFLNFALDELDGNSARYLGQTSVYGMMLDILLDETSVMTLCMALSTLYPQYIILFQLYSAIDFTAQWSCYQFSALYRNNNYTSTDDWIINTYFNQYVLTLFWVYGNHIFLLMLYLCYYTTGPVLSMFGMSVGLWKLMAILAAPWSLSRLTIMFYLLVTSLGNLGYYDHLKRVGRFHKQ